MRRLLILTLAALLLVLAACAPKPYEPAGEPTGNAALDDAVLALLQERCSAKNSEQENLRAVYDFIAHDITYRPGTADTSGGFSDELTGAACAGAFAQAQGKLRRAGGADGSLLRRMGYEAQLVQGTFVREEGAEPVDHAWVYALVGGEGVYFDPLYGGSFAERAEDYCMAPAALLKETHQWDENALQ